MSAAGRLGAAFRSNPFVRAQATPAPQVDVALVLAIDASGSVSQERMMLQIDGYLSAFRHPSLIRAVRDGVNGRIAATFVEWSDARRQDQAVGWTVIDGEATALAFTQAITQAPRANPGWTSISGAIDFSAKLFARGSFAASRRVIDISGDGTNNDGRPVEQARDDAVAAGITVNGLPILEVEPNLDDYYRANVIGGADSFIVIAQDIKAFGDAILRKLLVEIAGSDVYEAG
jgi:hypothetical protein